MPITARPSHSYRPDIDGLRAIAIIFVVIYHAFPHVLPGGFVGVDIFFVISGYLITGILHTNLTRGQFSIADFYARRVRRIFPALAVVLAFCYAVGWASLLNDEFRTLGKHVLAGALFVSNFAAWSESGYFDGSAQLKPLLHLWSLGIEEQFYLVWPLLLALAFRFGNRVRLMIVTMAAMSFAANLLLIPHHSAGAFYLPISRFWELLAGALLTQLPLSAIGKSRLRANALTIAGAGLLVLALVKLSPASRFPGIWALAPVAATCFLIAAGNQGWLNRRVLSNPVMVSLGKVSYPWYLWHWPLLSYATIIYGQTPSIAARLILVGLGLLLAYATYFGIECRARARQPRGVVVVAPLAAVMLVGTIGGATSLDNAPLPGRQWADNSILATATLGAGKALVEPSCPVDKSVQALFPFCYSQKHGPVNFAIWGDSKGDALYWGLAREAPEDQSWTIVGRPACTPMVGVNRISPDNGDNPVDCQIANPMALQALINAPNIKLVVIVTAARMVVGPTYADLSNKSSSSLDAAVTGMDSAIKALKNSGKDVMLMIDNPTLPDPKRCVDRPPTSWPIVQTVLGTPARCVISFQEHLRSTSTYRNIIQELRAKNSDLIIFDPTSLLCDMKAGNCSASMNGHFLYSYADHISDYANGLIAEKLTHTAARYSFGKDERKHASAGVLTQ